MRVIVIGYGSLLRQDDAVGQILAEALSERLPHVETITRTQLTIELAEPLSRAECAFFIDACAGSPPGAVTRQSVELRETGAMPSSGGTFSHDVTPETLLKAARDLYGSAPQATLIAVAGGAFDFSTELSPALQAALPRLIETVCAWVAEA